MEDQLYDRIMKFIKNYKFFFEDLDEKNPGVLFISRCVDSNEYMKKYYNEVISYYIVNFIRMMNYNKNEDRLINKYEYKSIILINDILTNNYCNIRYEITFFIINCIEDEHSLFIKYFEDKGLFYLLEKINPNELNLASNHQIKTANYIYNKLMEQSK